MRLTPLVPSRSPRVQPGTCLLALALAASIAGCSGDSGGGGGGLGPPGALEPNFANGGVLLVNPTPTNEVPVALAIDDDVLVVVGHDDVPGPTNRRWRIEKRRIGDGGLDLAFGQNGVIIEDPSGDVDEPVAVAVDPFALYIVGFDEFNGTGDRRWRIERRRRSDGDLEPTFGTNGVEIGNPSPASEQPMAMAVDSPWMFIAGYDSRGPMDDVWRVEKRDMSTGDLDPTFGVSGVVEVDPSPEDDRALAIAIDFLWFYVAGTDRSISATDSQWRVEKRALTNGSLDTGFGPGGAVLQDLGAGLDEVAGLAVDGADLYVAGTDTQFGAADAGWRVEKRVWANGFPETSFGVGGGASTNPSVMADRLAGVAVEGPFIYLVGTDYAPGPGNGRWRIERRKTKDSTLTDNFGVAGSITLDHGPLDDRATAVAVDDAYLYIIGTDTSAGDAAWRVEKRFN